MEYSRDKSEHIPVKMLDNCDLKIKTGIIIISLFSPNINITIFCIIQQENFV